MSASGAAGIRSHNVRATVLLVEDNPSDVLLIREALSRDAVECELHVVSDGAQAIEYIERLDADPRLPCPKLLMLDLNLPRESGEEVLKRVRLSARCKGIDVLIMSSSDAQSERQRAIRLGATDYFRKPSSLQEFMGLGPKVNSFLLP
jgi:CheY-like chemotaxis protein